ncbi:PASTA domain-containing protein [Euzebya pacifica]|uniref:PASTA domain-containing protein n=1 Tax=Euzebya pacifica TaxID=1608957 RepID=UPI0030FC8BD3
MEQHDQSGSADGFKPTHRKDVSAALAADGQPSWVEELDPSSWGTAPLPSSDNPSGPMSTGALRAPQPAPSSGPNKMLMGVVSVVAVSSKKLVALFVMTRPDDRAAAVTATPPEPTATAPATAAAADSESPAEVASPEESPTAVRVPAGLVGQPLLEVSELLADLGVRVDRTGEAVGAGVEAGTVLSVDPPAGQTLDADAVVLLTYAVGDDDPPADPTDDEPAEPPGSSAEIYYVDSNTANDPNGYRVVDVPGDDVLNVRSGPSVSNVIVGELPPWQTDIYRTGGVAETLDGVWWEIRMPETDGIGWAHSAYLGLAPTDYDPNDMDRYRVVGVPSNDTLNVRSGAGVDNPVVWELGPGQRGITRTYRVAVAAGAEWWELYDEATGMTGWIHSDYLQFDGRY